jgi:hypothetical protein
MSDSPIFAGWEPHKWKVCVPRLGGFGTAERNTGRWPVRPAGILPAAASERPQRSKTPLGAQTGKSVFLGSRGGGKKKQ